ncbi:hypothetical protein [Saccharothrix variisporea]|uniref:Uncharacterized protein n=1 Tax=Saccharothrix variisporea TaxID=543527 RepID=A0A495XIK2_9PSEU|nr:hypothetical protein [Saccharothrix variisporea]RKT74321.1 hypothetical protein DFJ66_7665 [Saccharothrix variisporea]
MDEDNSVLGRALRMQAEIRRLDASASAEQAAKSTAQRVRELESALADLTAQVRLARALSKYSKADVPLGDIHGGLAELQRQASTGLPKDRAVDTARRRVASSVAELAQRSQEVWRAWTTTAFEAVPANRLAGLDPARQRATRTMVEQLAQLRRKSKPAITDVVEFGTKHAEVLEELAAAADASDELLALLARFATTPITLRDITDEEIALLREHGMDGEIEIRRKHS